MIKYIFFSTLFLCIFIACSSESESNRQEEQVSNISTKDIANLLDHSPTAIDTTMQTTDSTVVAKSPPPPSPPKERIAAIDSLAKASENKEKTCEEILIEYETLVAEFLKTEDESILAKFNTGDVFFQSCIKNEPYKSKAAELEAKVDKIMDTIY